MPPSVMPVAVSSIVVVQFDGRRTVRRPSNFLPGDRVSATAVAAAPERATDPSVQPPAHHPAPSAPDAGPTPDPRRWRMLPVILSAMFMAMFDYFVVNVAAPAFQQNLHTTDAGLELIVGGYG